MKCRVELCKEQICILRHVGLKKSVMSYLQSKEINPDSRNQFE